MTSMVGLGIAAISINASAKRYKFYEEQGWTSVHPFADSEVIAGQGTLGLEVLEELPEVSDIIVSIGGGGLASGIATVLKCLHPETRIWGVETEGADAMRQALIAGRVVDLPRVTSIARTLSMPAVSELTLGIVRKSLEGVTVVSDREAVSSMHLLLERCKVLAEPAASCTLAAAERLRLNFSPDSQVVLVLCGGNTAVTDLNPKLE